MSVAKAALLLLEQGGRFLLFSNLIIFWTVHLVKSSSHLNWYFQGGDTWLGTSLLQRGSQVTWLCFGNRGEHLCLWRKNKKQTHLLCSTAIEIVIEITQKIIVNATPGERATPHRGSHPAPPIMKRGETSQLHLFMFRCGGRIPRSILMQLPRTLKVLVV